MLCQLTRSAIGKCRTRSPLKAARQQATVPFAQVNPPIQIAHHRHLSLRQALHRATVQIVMLHTVQRHLYRRLRQLPNLTRPETAAIDEIIALGDGSTMPGFHMRNASVGLHHTRHRTVLDDLAAQRARLLDERLTDGMRIADTVVRNPQAAQNVGRVDERRARRAIGSG